jgi:hypothetical protein
MSRPSPRKLRLAMLALLAVAGLVLSACGDSHTRVTTGTYAGESGANAPYLNVGPLIYEVQISRELNPFNEEDSQYLLGLEGAEAKLQPGQEWFAVFLQVYNNTSHELPASDQVTIFDTQGNTYSPIVPNQTNLFAYRGGGVPAKGQLPVAGSVADQVGSQGQVLLFKIQLASLDNRPIKIKIVDPEDPSQFAQAELDV